MPSSSDRVRPRFLAPDLDPAAAETQLPPDESRHLSRVLRLEAGAVVSVFDGRGRECLAKVTDARGPRATLAILASITPVAEPAVSLTLLQAVLKGAAMDDVVRDATMMGAARIQPVLTEHVVVKPAIAARGETLERWKRVAVASAKQSRRATIPEVLAPMPLDAALGGDPSALRLMFVEPSAARVTQPVRSLMALQAPPLATLLVGPEGGWSSGEIDLAVERGALLISLGALTLRADAMAIAAMAVVRMLWE